MSDVEFVSAADDEGALGPGPRRPLRLKPALGIGAAALVAVVVAALVVVGQQSDSAHRRATAASPSHSASRSASPSTAPSSVPTLSLPEHLAFGPATQDVLAVGDRIFGLTTKLIGVVARGGGALTVRPAPLGLGVAGRPKLVFDEPLSILWTVAIGGTSIGAYEIEHLATRTDDISPYPIRAAAALQGELWFTTTHGLYRYAPGMAKPIRMSASPLLQAIAADPSRNRVLVLDGQHIYAWSARGQIVPVTLPFARADAVAVAGGHVWAAGHYSGAGIELFQLDPRTLQAGAPPLTGAGPPAILATFNDRLLVTGVGPAGQLSCITAQTGAVRQSWPYRGGAVTLNERGLLLTDGSGIELLNARDCLAGS